MVERHTTWPGRSRAAASWLAVLALGLHWADASAARGNPFGFTQAANSSVNYAATPHTAVLGCAAMAKTTASGVVLNAQLVAATATVPEHCRISGTIPAEIGFEINLP